MRYAIRTSHHAQRFNRKSKLVRRPYGGIVNRQSKTCGERGQTIANPLYATRYTLNAFFISLLIATFCYPQIAFADGSIVAWGYNDYGQCNIPSPNTGFIAISAGGLHSLGLKEDNSVVAWGYNYYGQCNVPSPDSGFIAISAGYEHSLGLKEDGSIVAWGRNYYGQCNIPSPNSDFIAISAGSGHSLGLKNNGSIVAWGDNYFGQCNIPSPNSDFIAISAGDWHSLGLKEDGSIVAWGDNCNGQCDVPSPNTHFSAISAGIWHSLGLKEDGSIVAWGYNGVGQCNIPSPNTGFIAISAGGCHSLGLKSECPQGAVVIYPSQSYQVATKVLSLSAAVTDTLYGAVTSGIFTWSLRNSSGSQIANGNLSYNTSAAKWLASQTITAGLPAGNYTIRYNIVTNRGRTASATGYLAVEATFNLSGKICDGTTGAALPDVQVSVAAQNVYTNSQGIYSLNNLNAEQAATITAAKTGYATYTANLNPPSAGSTIVHDFDMYPQQVAKPVITGLTGKYNGIFLAGISTDNQYTATVQWNGTPGTVEFYANNTLKATVPGTTTGAKATFNMGSDFPPVFSASANKVRVFARNAGGAVSDWFEKPVIVIPLPSAAVQITPWFSIQTADSEVHLAADFSFPEPPIAGPITLPVIGKFGAEVAANASFDYTVTDGDWEAAFGIGAEGTQGKRGRRPTIPGLTRCPKLKLYIGNKEISGKIEGGARGTATITNGITFDEVFARAGIGAKLELGRVGLLDVIPGLSTATGWIPGLSDITKAISIIIYVEPELNGELVFALDPQFAFDHLEIAGDVGLEAAYEPDLGICEMRLYVGGKPGVTFQIPGEFIKQLRFKAYAGAEFRAWLITIGPIEYVFVNVTIPAEEGHGAATTQVFVLKSAASQPLQPRPIDRSYLAAGPSRFVAYETLPVKTSITTQGPLPERLSPLQAFRAMGKRDPKLQSVLSDIQGPVLLQADLPLIENVFPYSQPALAGQGSELMLLYVSDNNAPGDLQFTDINWLRFDGTDWTAPEPIVADTRAEFAPQVAFDGDSDAVAVWERVKDPDFNTLDIEAMAAQMEIVWSRWDRVSGNWSQPEALTDNNCLDHDPLLAGPMDDGTLLTIWTQNDANLLMGDSNNSSTVLWSKWNPTTHSWSSPQVLLSNLSYRLSQSFSGAASEAVFAWTADLDGDVNTTNDQELFICQWNEPNWGSPLRLTNDTVPDRNVRVAVADDNDLYLVWQRANDLVMEHNLTGISLVREDSETVAFTDYAMTLGPAGNLVLLWQEQSEDGVDTFYSVFDPASGRWSKDNRIFADSSLERSFAPVWDDVGNLTVAYNRVQITKTTKTVELEGGEIIEVNDVPTPGRVDLGILKRALVKDLALNPGDFTAEGTNYLPGDEVKLSANVHNTGDISIENVTVAFYDGDPNDGGVEIARHTIPGWLDGSSITLAEATWLVPEPANTHTLYAVIDPNNQVSEVNESNNKLSLGTGGTDLTPRLLSVKSQDDGSARLIIEVFNSGAPTAPQNTLAIRKAGQSGPPITTAQVPEVKPGRLHQIALDLPSSTLVAGNNFFTVKVDDANEVDDVDVSNNQMTFCVYYPQLGEFNLDGRINMPDFALLALHWLDADCNDPDWCGKADLNKSGAIDFYDLAELVENWL